MKTFKRIAILILTVSLIFVGTVNSSDTNKKVCDWNFLVYMVSNNNLHGFADKNISQMLEVGSNKNINILVQVDTYGKNEACRYFISKNDPVLIEAQTNNFQSISGTPDNLFGFVQWAVKSFPAKHQALILWDHGSGVQDPNIWGKDRFNYPRNIFYPNPKTGLLELDRKYRTNKGIGFNEIFQKYLTNQDITLTVEKISNELLKGKKIDIIGMDACLMSMVEIGSQLKDYVSYMVSSQEVEPGSGWEYNRVLEPFIYKTFTPEEFSKQIVFSYKDAYQYTHTNYTQSSVDLSKHEKLEINIDSIATLLVKVMQGENSMVFTSNIRRIRNSLSYTTSFSNKDYIDLQHFYKSLLDVSISLEDRVFDRTYLKLLQDLLLEGIQLIKHSVVDNVSCNRIPNANGLSIYFPVNKIHSSYYKTIFAKNNNWINFIDMYLKKTQCNYC